MMTETKNNERVFTNRRERNYGIDLLRIVSMIMVTILHFSGYGGFLGTPENGLSYYVLSLIMVIYAMVQWTFSQLFPVLLCIIPPSNTQKLLIYGFKLFFIHIYC